MASLDLILSIGVALIVVYVGYKYFAGGPDVESSTLYSNSAASGGAGGDSGARDFIAKMRKNKKNVIVFYGSQTGTAEDLASKLSKELSSKFGLRSMTADPENFDFENLDQFPEDFLAIFLMASYGDGEPTDNAQDVYQFLSSSPSFSDGGEELPNLHFAVFGLGNRSYEFYNQVGKDMHKFLTGMDAKCIGPYGEGDDSKGLLEEDFLAWKEDFFSALVSQWGVEEREAVYEPSLVTEELSDVADADVYRGEPNLKHLQARKTRELPSGPYTPSNPLPSRVVEAHELFTNTDRHCIHMEFDTKGLRYTTGDHLAFWCQNSEEEVQRFISALGLKNPEQAISIKLLDTTSTLHVPSPTTYETVIRNFLGINGPVSRQVLSTIAGFAPTAAAKESARNLAGNKELFAHEVTAKCFNLARLMLHLSNNEPWTSVPFNFIIETVPHLQPRYYSISSSSLETPDRISITAVVERQKPAGADHEIRGVATNEILALEHAHNGKADNSFKLSAPTTAKDELRVPVHVRHSVFKLPAKATVPIIMVGPGTGVAPFRGFVRERAALAAQGKPVGKAMLFFGSRHEDQDYLYRDEWSKHSDWLEVHTAFSRDGPSKVYVQTRMKEHASKVNELLEEGAVFYVCGDAGRMARDVHTALLEIIATARGISEEEAEKFVRKMRSRNKYQEDVW